MIEVKNVLLKAIKNMIITVLDSISLTFIELIAEHQ